MTTNTILFKKLHEKATLPKQATPGDAGYDLCCVEDFRIHPGQTIVVPTGLAIADAPKYISYYSSAIDYLLACVSRTGQASPSNTLKIPYFLQLMSRSGLASKGLYVIGGVVDSSYRGEIKVVLHNGNESNPLKGYPQGLGYDFKAGERIAQLVVQAINTDMQFLEATDQTTTSETVRGSGGFGSTGS